MGKPIRSGGRKHEKSRYRESNYAAPLPSESVSADVVTNIVVEINFRLPSMLHGKKGFERIAWAFRNVLNASVTWLFCDLAAPGSLLREGQYPVLWAITFAVHFLIHG